LPHATIAPALKTRRDARLALGTSRVIARGIPGMRETTVRFEKRDDGPAVSTIIASRIVRAPSAKIVVRGARRYPSLAGVARQGFASALHFAGSALHMLASAYTAGCYGCTGMTASGLHAGFGVIAVDPSIIPLGTKLFIPGYGRAVAGDTGGAIHGHRIDLGFNTNGEAFEWGSRAVTVYLLR
jgi:3D (Asp-Asp-Asp) domain-containing protein